MINIDRIQNASTSESSQGDKSCKFTQFILDKDKKVSPKRKIEIIDGITNNVNKSKWDDVEIWLNSAPKEWSIRKHKMCSQFTTRSNNLNPLQSRLEEQLKSLENKMTNLIQSSQNNVSDSWSKGTLLSKINDLRGDFENWSKLLLLNKKSEQKPEIEFENNNLVFKNSNGARNTTFNKNKNLKKKDYMGTAPIVNFEISNDAWSTPKILSSRANTSMEKYQQQWLIKQSLSKIIKKNIKKIDCKESIEK